MLIKPLLLSKSVGGSLHYNPLPHTQTGSLSWQLRGFLPTLPSLANRPAEPHRVLLRQDHSLQPPVMCTAQQTPVLRGIIPHAPGPPINSFIHDFFPFEGLSVRCYNLTKEGLNSCMLRLVQGHGVTALQMSMNFGSSTEGSSRQRIWHALAHPAVQMPGLCPCGCAPRERPCCQTSSLACNVRGPWLDRDVMDHEYCINIVATYIYI